jgi:type 1 glutamine amidotransferase
MKARIAVKPEILALTKEGLPRKKPFQVNGLLSVEELQAEVKKRKQHRTVPEVKATVPEMYKKFKEIAESLKQISVAIEELKGVGLEETIEV